MSSISAVPLTDVVNREQVDTLSVSAVRDKCVLLSAHIMWCSDRIEVDRKALCDAQGRIEELAKANQELCTVRDELRRERAAPSRDFDRSAQQCEDRENENSLVQQLQFELNRVQRENEQLLRQAQVDQESIACDREYIGLLREREQRREAAARAAPMDSHVAVSSRFEIAECPKQDDSDRWEPRANPLEPPRTAGSQPTPHESKANAQFTVDAAAIGRRNPGSVTTAPFYREEPSLRELVPVEDKQSAYCPNAMQLMAKVPRYTGNVDDRNCLFTDWLKDLTIRLDTLGIDVRSMAALNVLRDNLGGAALQAFELIPNHHRSFEYAVWLLTDKFNARSSFSADYHKFVTTRQDGNEPCDEFARRLQICAQQIFRTQDERIIDALLRGQFVSGLFDESIQGQVKLDRSLNNFVDVVSFARHIEQHQKEMRALRGKQRLPQQGWVKTRESSNAQPTAPPPTVAPGRTTTRPAGTARSFECWSCGAKDHRSDKCPARARGEARPQQGPEHRANEVWSDRQERWQSPGGGPPPTSFYDYVARDPHVSARHTADMVNVRTMTAELKAGLTLFGPSTEAVFDVCGLASCGPIDSGSQTSIISYELVRRLRERDCIDIREACADCPIGLDVRSVTNEQLPILGLLTLKVTAPTGRSICAPFLVQKYGLGHDILIGTNYMSQLGYSLVAEGVCNPAAIRHALPIVPPIDDGNQATSATVRVAKTHCILSRCEQKIRVCADRPLTCPENAQVLFEPQRQHTPKGLQMQPMVVQVDDQGQYEVWVRNLSTAKLCLSKDEPIGAIEIVSAVMPNEVPDSEQNQHQPTKVCLVRQDDELNRADRAQRLLESVCWADCALAPDAVLQLRDLIVEFSHVFAMDNMELGQTHLVTHTIDTGEAKPIKQPVRPCPFALREKVAELTQQYLDQGVISPSRSP
uniref:CCHC-type domain-containing protein n=1 Tax=Plectus sambesii TaxID=2011161 RepID=A0A914X7W9_9BILA